MPMLTYLLLAFVVLLTFKIPFVESNLAASMLNFPPCALGVNENMKMCTQEREEVLFTCVLGFWLMTPLEVGKCCKIINGAAVLSACNNTATNSRIVNPGGMNSDGYCLNTAKTCGLNGHVSYQCLNRKIRATVIPHGVCCKVIDGVYSESPENCEDNQTLNISYVKQPLPQIHESDYFHPRMLCEGGVPCHTLVDICTEDGLVLLTYSDYMWQPKLTSSQPLNECCAPGVIPSSSSQCAPREYCENISEQKCSDDGSQLLTCDTNRWVALDTQFAPNCCFVTDGVPEIDAECMDSYCPIDGESRCSPDFKVIERCESHIWTESTQREDFLCCSIADGNPVVKVCE